MIFCLLYNSISCVNEFALGVIFLKTKLIAFGNNNINGLLIIQDIIIIKID